MLNTSFKDSVNVFNNDVIKYNGYKYTNEKFSSIIANKTLTMAILNAIDLNNMSIIDAGCGDGTYTQEFFEMNNPSKVIGIDPSIEAITLAKTKNKFSNCNYICSSINNFELNNEEIYDILIFRGVLHHLEDPEAAIKKALSIAKKIVIIEPNGYNPILKIIEKTSKYHREHNEKSYGFQKLNKWIELTGGTVIYHKRVGIVPYFCADWIAKTLKFIEPVVEKIPFINIFCCAVDIIVYESQKEIL